MIANHNKLLGRVMTRADELLKLAKNEGGRNGFAFELDKCSGGGRMSKAKWEETRDGIRTQMTANRNL